MSNYRIASRYDKSLLTLAIEQGIVEEVHQDMVLLAKVARENPALVTVLNNPVISHQKKLNILKALFQDRATKLTMSLFEIISKKNREDILPELAGVFHQQYNEYKGITEATVYTEYPIDDEQRKKFIALVKEKTNAKTVDLKEEIDHDIIGGYKITIGDKQIDDTLRTKLNELKIKFES